MKTETYTLPAFWAPVLINADESGLSAEDTKTLNAWLYYAKPGYCIDCSDQGFFTPFHDAIGYVLACDCLEFSFGVSE